MIKLMEKGTVVPQGYEPKAMERSSSLPPNPFWSERAQMEHRLTESRPEELPIPDDEEGVSEGEGKVNSPEPLEDVKAPKSKEAEGPKPGKQPSREAMTRKRSRSAPRSQKEKFQEDQDDQGSKFHTPASWENPTGTGRGGGNSGGREIQRSTGRVEAKEELTSQLQQDIERAMFAQLRQEKEELQQQVSRLEAKLQQKGKHKARSSTPQCAYEEPTLQSRMPPHSTPQCAPEEPALHPTTPPYGRKHSVCT